MTPLNQIHANCRLGAISSVYNIGLSFMQTSCIQSTKKARKYVVWSIDKNLKDSYHSHSNITVEQPEKTNRQHEVNRSKIIKLAQFQANK